MSVKERAKLFEAQSTRIISLSPLASRSTLSQPSENVSSSNHPSLYNSQNARGGQGPLSSYQNGQAVQVVQLGADALKTLSSAQLGDMPPLLPSRPSSPGRQEDGHLIILDADECSE